MFDTKRIDALETRMDKVETDVRSILDGQAQIIALLKMNSTPTKSTKKNAKSAPKKADDGKVEYTQVKDGKTIRVTPKQKEFLEARAEYLSGNSRKRTEEEKQAYKDEYNRRWEAWRKSANHDKNRNKEVHAMIVADIRANRPSKF